MPLFIDLLIVETFPTVDFLFLKLAENPDYFFYIDSSKKACNGLIRNTKLHSRHFCINVI